MCQTPGIQNVQNAECELPCRFLYIVWYFAYGGTQGPAIFCRWNHNLLLNLEKSFFCSLRLHLVLKGGFLLRSALRFRIHFLLQKMVARVCHYICTDIDISSTEDGWPLCATIFALTLTSLLQKINVKNCSLYTLLTATDRKPQKS